MKLFAGDAGPGERRKYLLLKALRELGERWHRGEISVAVEHFGSSLIRSKLTVLLDSLRHTGKTRRVLCACPAGDLHDGGLLMFALEAADQGWQPIYLGPDLPLPGLATAVLQSDPRLVAISIVLRRSPEELRRLFSSLYEAVADRCPVLIGGGGTAGHEDLVLASGCQLMPKSGKLDDLTAPSRTRRQ